MRYDIFPTPFWHIENEIPQPLVDELYQGAYKFKDNHESVSYPNYRGYQSPGFNWEDFHPYGKEVVKDIVSKAIEIDFNISNWWYNINGKEAWNLPHCHPGSDLALVLYLTETDDLLHLINPFSQRRLNETSTYVPSTKKGDILIFPSDIQHFVMPNQKEEDRISISMNLQLS